MSPTAGKQRQIANFSSESPRPNFSLVSDENRAAMIGCLRRIAKILYRNERQIHEQNRISAENNLTKRNNSMSVTDSFIRNIFSSPTEKNNRINSLRKPTLPVEIVDILRNAKSNFMDLFEVRICFSLRNSLNIFLRSDFSSEHRTGSRRRGIVRHFVQRKQGEFQRDEKSFFSIKNFFLENFSNSSR